MGKIKTIDKLPRSVLIELALKFGFREHLITEDVSNWYLANFISMSI